MSNHHLYQLYQTSLDLGESTSIVGNEDYSGNSINFDFHGITFEGTDFTNATFSGDVRGNDFENAQLRGACFKNARIEGCQFPPDFEIHTNRGRMNTSEGNRKSDVANNWSTKKIVDRFLLSSETKLVHLALVLSLVAIVLLAWKA